MTPTLLGLMRAPTTVTRLSDEPPAAAKNAGITGTAGTAISGPAGPSSKRYNFCRRQQPQIASLRTEKQSAIQTQHEVPVAVIQIDVQRAKLPLQFLHCVVVAYCFDACVSKGEDALRISQS